MTGGNKSMRKWVAVAASVLLPAGAVFAAAEAETGRSAASEQVAGGQLLPIGSIDPGSYLSDFECDVVNTGDDAMVVQVELMQDLMWDRGGSTGMRILLAANQESYFPPTPGLFVVLFQNPELLRDTGFVDSMSALVDDHGGLDVRILDPVNAELIVASTPDEFRSATSALSRQVKVYDQNVLIQRALAAMSDEDSTRSHLLWITDENIAERAADMSFFSFAVELLAGADTTFSYLAYGESPNWPAINDTLLKRNGNSYYADDADAIVTKAARDLSYFHRPAIEDVQVSIDFSRPVRENNTFYPSSYYGLLQEFRPMFNNGRPRSYHSLGGMNYGETKRYIHYVELPSYPDLVDVDEPSPLLNGRSFTVATVFVRYYLPMSDQWLYVQHDVQIRYVPAASADAVTIKPNVELDVIIQNTPLILLEAAMLVNSNRNYLLALKLLQAQTRLLERMSQNRPDEAIDEDIVTLNNYYTIVFEQAKAVNLLE